MLARQEHGRPFALPPGTPADIVATYRQAFAAMARDPAFLADAAHLKADILPASGDEVSGFIAKIYSTPRELVERAIAEFRRAGGR